MKVTASDWCLEIDNLRLTQKAAYPLRLSEKVFFFLLIYDWCTNDVFFYEGDTSIHWVVIGNIMIDLNGYKITLRPFTFPYYP